MADIDIDQDELQRRALQGEILGLPPNIAQQTLGIPPASLAGRAMVRGIMQPQPIPKAMPASQPVNPDVTPPPLNFPPQPPSAATIDPVMMPAGGAPKQSAWLESQKPGWQQIHNPFLRGLAGVGSTIADIAAPGLSSRIPGTGMHHDFLVHQALGREAAQGQEAEREAQTQEAQARAVALQHPKPQLEMTDEGLVRVPEQGSATPVTMAGQGLHKPTTEAKPTFEKMADGSIVQIAADAQGKPQATVVYKGDPAEQTQIVDQEVNGQPHNVIIDKRTGNVVKDLGRKGHEAPNVGVNLIVPTAGGGQQLIRATPGTNIPQGAVGTTALNPTQTMRNAAAQADIVEREMPNVIGELQTMKNSLGPVEGRWNDFMQGKVGMDNPDFAGLRADLLMMSSAVALMHARGRLPENLRAEFDHAINAPRQTADNLISILQHMDKWVKTNKEVMSGGAGSNQPASQTGNDPLGVLK